MQSNTLNQITGSRANKIAAATTIEACSFNFRDDFCKLVYKSPIFTNKDDNFRKMLLENPDEALKDFSLSDREKSKFKGIGQEQLMAFKSQLDKRFSKE